MPAISPDAPPHRSSFLARQPFRRKLALIVGIPSLVALLGSLLALGRVASAYHRSQILEKANASSTLLIQAATFQAKERGFTSAVLSDPAAQTTRAAIPDLRQQGDTLLDAALAEAQSSLAGNRVLAAAYQTLQRARTVRDAKRAEVDGALAPGQSAATQPFVQAWFDAQTTLIQAERIFGSTLFLAQNPYELVIQYNGYIKANVFVASEFAGRERALLGRFIAGNTPITPARLDELQRWRGVVEENLAAIVQLRANPAMSRPVLDAIDTMQAVFLSEYEKSRALVYDASARQVPYPLTTDAWIAESTRGINSIIAVSDRIGEEAARISRAQAAFSLANVLFIVGLMGLLALAVAASVWVARDLARRLAELRAAAERVSQGVYSQPVGGAASAGLPGDEFAALASVFNTMQARVEAGVAQLQAEKAGVEARVTERTRELVEVNVRLRTLNAEKDTFLGICSHDLKNPLSGILGLAGLIEADPGETAQVREYAADILQASEFMFHLVGNLLDIGAIEQGKFNLTSEPVPLVPLVARGVENYRRRATEKNIRLDVALPTEGFIVQADPRALLQVVDNLVSNAVKYTPKGGNVTVRFRALPDAAGVELSVRDTGPGLSAEDQRRLFQKYTRLSAQPTGGEHSTGLGLSIVKQLVEAMGGEVRCDSALGNGSTFAVRLPVG